VEVVASLSQGRTAAAQCGLFTYKSVPVIFEPPCIYFVILFSQPCAKLEKHRKDYLRLLLSSSLAMFSIYLEFGNKNLSDGILHSLFSLWRNFTGAMRLKFPIWLMCFASRQKQQRDLLKSS